MSKSLTLINDEDIPGRVRATFTSASECGVEPDPADLHFSADLLSDVAELRAGEKAAEIRGPATLDIRAPR